MYTDAMLAFNGTAEMFSYDNRPMAPLQQYTFDQWWMVSVDQSVISLPFRIPTALSPLSARPLEI